MKKTLKIVLPILLIFALLIAAYWFFFQYRVDITTGLLRDFADSQFNSGRYSMAIRCYRWASSLDPNDADLSLKLAEAYRKSGNYSKTENVLVNAIYGAPGDVRLYEALSRVYVEQDKLLDAQQMLDGISNPEVQAELAARRPAAPVVSPPGAFYDEYITVEISVAGGAACYSTVDGTYPSQEQDAYGGPIQLPGGQTTVCAVAVSGDGLVSPVVYEAYTVAGVIEEVTFRDEALKAEIQELLHRGNRTIRTDDLWDIEELTLPDGLTETDDLRYFTGMNKLVGLNLGELDYSFLTAMPELRYLDLENCVLTQEALEQIGACPNLEVLILANCGLTDVAPLGGLTTLRVLDLSYNALTYVGAVSVCPTIERLNVSHNRLTSATPFSALKSLVWFNGSNNRISDVSVMAPCTKLESFIMTDNKLTDVDFLAGCPAIREINVDYNDIVNTPAFEADCPLESFSAAHNFLEELNGLAGLQKLTYVNADYNNIRDIDILQNCPVLTQVNVYNTNVHSGGVLAEKGVVVNFTPNF